MTLQRLLFASLLRQTAPQIKSNMASTSTIYDIFLRSQRSKSASESIILDWYAMIRKRWHNDVTLLNEDYKSQIAFDLSTTDSPMFFTSPGHNYHARAIAPLSQGSTSPLDGKPYDMLQINPVVKYEKDQNTILFVKERRLSPFTLSTETSIQHAAFTVTRDELIHLPRQWIDVDGLAHIKFSENCASFRLRTYEDVGIEKENSVSSTMYWPEWLYISLNKVMLGMPSMTEKGNQQHVELSNHIKLGENCLDFYLNIPASEVVTRKVTVVVELVYCQSIISI